MNFTYIQLAVLYLINITFEDTQNRYIPTSNLQTFKEDLKILMPPDVFFNANKNSYCPGKLTIGRSTFVCKSYDQFQF